MSEYNQQILPPGAVLQSRYEVVKVLGVGGMGAVYLAQDLRFTGVVRHCAIKEMVISTPDPHTRRLAMQGFNREANFLVQLNHPGIPKIYDFFNESNRSYLVMEYITGENLESILESSEKMLDEKTVLGWAIQVCDVLTYLHSQTPPVIFRDLKPANIMLRKEQNRIALIDFGIAKSFEVGQKGTMIGTEGYSPPEQYRGIADPRGDIYALAATMHHLLTKRDPRLEPPFTFHQAPPKTLNPSITDESNAIIMKALQYNPDDRFPSAIAFKDSLSAIQQAKFGKIEASTATQVLPQKKVLDIAPAPAPQPMQMAPQPYPPQAYSYPPPGYAYPPAGYPGYPPPGYPMPYPGQPMPPQAEEKVDDKTESVTPIWTFKCEDEIRGTPSADKKTIFIGSYDHNLYALDLKTGQFLWKYATDGGIVTRPFVYRDRLIFGSEDRVAYAVSLTGRLVWTCPTQGRIRSSTAVDFDHAFFGSDDGKFYAVNAQNGRIIWEYVAMGPIRSSPALGEESVFVGSDDGNVVALDLRKGSARWKYRVKRGVTSSPVIYQKKIVIFGSADKGIYGADTKSGYPLWQVRTKQPVISSPAIFEDAVYIGSTDNNLYALNAETGKQLWAFDAKSSIVSTPAVTAEAIYFGTAAGEVISLGRKDKKVRWRFKTQGAVTGSPLVISDVVYIGSTDHQLYALPA